MRMILFLHKQRENRVISPFFFFFFFFSLSLSLSLSLSPSLSLSLSLSLFAPQPLLPTNQPGVVEVAFGERHAAVVHSRRRHATQQAPAAVHVGKGHDVVRVEFLVAIKVAVGRARES
mgnify:CR=1 FL=1